LSEKSQDKVREFWRKGDKLLLSFTFFSYCRNESITEQNDTKKVKVIPLILLEWLILKAQHSDKLNCFCNYTLLMSITLHSLHLQFIDTMKCTVITYNITYIQYILLKVIDIAQFINIYYCDILLSLNYFFIAQNFSDWALRRKMEVNFASIVH